MLGTVDDRIGGVADGYQLFINLVLYKYEGRPESLIIISENCGRLQTTTGLNGVCVGWQESGGKTLGPEVLGGGCLQWHAHPHCRLSLRYAPRQMYDVVADVGSYRLFTGLYGNK